MSASSSTSIEHDCSATTIDAGDEMVCTVCGVVSVKEVISTSLEAMDSQSGKRRIDVPPEEFVEGALHILDYTSQGLGSYMGPNEDEYLSASKRVRFFSTSSSSPSYLKMLSDHTIRADSLLLSCSKTVERVAEKLRIPEMAMAETILVLKNTLELRKGRHEWNSASLSAFSMITACKIHGVTSVGVREIIEAHRIFGHVVRNTILNQMALESPMIRPAPRRAEEYLGRVVGRLPQVEKLVNNLHEAGYNEVTYFHQLYEVASKVLETVDVELRAGRNPCGTGAAAVYMAEVVLAKKGGRKMFMSQKDVAQCVGMREYTIREQYGKIFAPLLEKILSTMTGKL